jgi:hypothetical protein
MTATTTTTPTATGTLAYSDFFFLIVLAIVIQIIAIAYLWKIHRYIGRKMTLLLGAINVLQVIFNILVGYILLAASTRQNNGAGEIDILVLVAAYIIPLASGILHLILQRTLAKSLGMD